ncbi:hypothetical protein GGF46_002187 [Coemansia sp. RSA 552]|nr:hypothetical protein GGF46_002187 [Coemansia sp. RSA 552]
MFWQLLLAVLALSWNTAHANVLEDAATATDTEALMEAASSDWASVFYRINFEINSASMMDETAKYESLTSLYETTQIPPYYIEDWFAGYIERVKSEDAPESESSEKESSEKESSRPDTSEPDDEDTEGGAVGSWTLSALAVIAGAMALA